MDKQTTASASGPYAFDPQELVHHIDQVVAEDKGSPLSASARAEVSAALAAVAQSTAQGASPPYAFSMEPREVTVLWAKLRGGPATDSIQPQAADLEPLNRCLARLIEVITRFQGTIDQLSGDAIKVLFGADGARAGDVERAVMCAVEMQMAMRDLNMDHLRDRVPQVFMGIGVSTGKALAGRLGSAAYSHFTVIGDLVNLAFRLQAFSLRGQVLISEETYERCWGLVSATAPMQVFVKGYSHPITMRELVAIPTRRLKVPRQEFRRSHRVEVRIPCSYQIVQDGVVLPHVAQATIRDMGYHGAMLELVEPLDLQGEVRLSFDLTLVRYQARDIYARVVTLKAEGEQTMAGVEFTSTSAEFEARTQMFVQMMVAAA
jgi:adenylate cyclase